MLKDLITELKITICFILICCTPFSIEAQHEPQSNTNQFWQNVRFGGGIGLSFGDGFFSGSLLPSGIYQFNDQFATGFGLNYTYSKQKNIYKSTILGGSILALFNPIREIQLSTEFEQLHISRNFDNNFVTNSDDNYWYSALFFGIGYRSGSVTVGVRYDILYDRDRSLYFDPWVPFVRVYF